MHIPIRSFAEPGYDAKLKKDWTHFTETEREVVSEVILLFKHYIETGSQAMQRLRTELAALHVSHSAFCVHSIVSALIITHARAQFRPHICASPCTIILLWQKTQAVPLWHLCVLKLCCIHHACDCV